MPLRVLGHPWGTPGAVFHKHFFSSIQMAIVLMSFFPSSAFPAPLPSVILVPTVYIPWSQGTYNQFLLYPSQSLCLDPRVPFSQILAPRQVLPHCVFFCPGISSPLSQSALASPPAHQGGCPHVAITLSGAPANQTPSLTSCCEHCTSSLGSLEAEMGCQLTR